MNCYLHPEVPATSFCSNCGKALCQDCAVEMNGKIYCRACLQAGAAATPAPYITAVPNNRLALISMCLGIAGWVIFFMLFCCNATLGSLIAIATLGIGLICLIPITLIPYLGWIASVITGHIALKQLNEPGNTEAGRGMAKAGLIMSYIALGLTVLGIIVVIVLVVLSLIFGASIPIINQFSGQLQ